MADSYNVIDASEGRHPWSTRAPATQYADCCDGQINQGEQVVYIDGSPLHVEHAQ